MITANVEARSPSWAQEVKHHPQIPDRAPFYLPKLSRQKYSHSTVSRRLLTPALTKLALRALVFGHVHNQTELNPSPTSHRDRDSHLPSLSILRLSTLEAFTNRMQRVSKTKQSKIFPGTCSNLTPSAQELKRFKNVSWRWSERDQKVAKQRGLHSDTWERTLLLRQPFSTLWLLDHIQNSSFFGNSVPGSDTVILKLFLQTSFFKRSGMEGDKDGNKASFTQAPFYTVLPNTTTFLLCWCSDIWTILHTGSPWSSRCELCTTSES